MQEIDDDDEDEENENDDDEHSVVNEPNCYDQNEEEDSEIEQIFQNVYNHDYSKMSKIAVLHIQVQHYLY